MLETVPGGQVSLFRPLWQQSVPTELMSPPAASRGSRCPCPLPQALADPQRFGSLPPEQRRCVLLGLWYGLNWCRELANSFAPLLMPNG